MNTKESVVIIDVQRGAYVGVGPKTQAQLFKDMAGNNVVLVSEEQARIAVHALDRVEHRKKDAEFLFMAFNEGGPSGTELWVYAPSAYEAKRFAARKLGEQGLQLGLEESSWNIPQDAFSDGRVYRLCWEGKIPGRWISVRRIRLKVTRKV